MNAKIVLCSCMVHDESWSTLAKQHTNVRRIVSVAVQSNCMKMMMKFLLNGVKELNGHILKNAQVWIETSKLLR